MAARTPQFKIGQQFKTRGKHPVLFTIVDIYTTFNAAGEQVKFRYVAARELLGQKVFDYEVVETTVAMGLVETPDHQSSAASSAESSAADGRQSAEGR